MAELWITFVDHEGCDQRVRVEKDEYVIGRHTSADLCFPNDRLSREHVRIERTELDFIASDCGSTNGTLINGNDLYEPMVLRSGDQLNLGDALVLSIDLVEAVVEEEDTPSGEDLAPLPEPDQGNAAAAPEVLAPAVTVGSEPTFSAGLFAAAAVFGVLLVGILGVLIYAFASNGDPKRPAGNEFVYTNDPDDDPPIKNKNSDSSPKPEKTATADKEPSNVVVTDTPSNTGPAKDLSETAKSEKNAALFLRKIAQNDPKAFLTTEQAKLVNDKIKQASTSSALIDNINSARKNAAQISSIATSKNLKPSFLAAAAITKLGGSRGDVIQTARAMAEVFAKLETQIGNELFDDALLMVAAYDQGASGDFMRMRNMLQNLATQYPESSRSIRTIWFLHEKGKIDDPEFDFALRFISIGTIMQNPKDFNVNCDALSL